MAKIMVPEQVYPGFKIISNLSDINLNLLIEYLNDFPIGRFYGEIAEDLSTLLKIDGDDLLRTFLSFTDLLTEHKKDIGLLSKNLADSYKELSKSLSGTKANDKLKKNLLQILSNFEKVQLANMVREYKVENSNNFREFKFLTDIRVLPNEHSETDEKYGIILHKFLIEYQNSSARNELYLHVDLDILIDLKIEIEKAIDRDKMLRESFSSDIILI